jgi:carbon monoxide dehydrogenase subunit G
MPQPSQGALGGSRPRRERTVAATATVPAPPEAVWELVSDPERFAEWADRTIEVIRADRPLSLGSTYEEVNAVLGPITGRSRWTVVEHQPPHRATHRGEGLPLTAGLDSFVELRPVENATELTLGLRYRPALGPLGSLLDRLHARRSLRASMQRSVRNVAAIAERELSSAG